MKKGLLLLHKSSRGAPGINILNFQTVTIVDVVLLYGILIIGIV